MKKMIVCLLVFLSAMTTAYAQSVPGDTVTIQGQLLNEQNQPIQNGIVQLWQTDYNGIYDHPNAPNNNTILNDFQYYGSSVVDAEGNYSFRTMRPAEYPGRPAHLHIKIWVDGQEALITQFYIEDERALFEQDTWFLRAGDLADMLVIDIQPNSDTPDEFIATKNIYLNLSGEETAFNPTPVQIEGPFYPVVDFLEYDNDFLEDATPTSVSLVQQGAEGKHKNPIILLLFIAIPITIIGCAIQEEKI